MNNKESQSGGNPQGGETDKTNRYTYENEGAEQNVQETEEEQAAREELENQAAAAAEPLTVHETPFAPGAPEGPSAPAKKSGSLGWIILSAVLAVALVIVLIKPPFGGGSNETIATVNGTNITKDDLYNLLVKYNGEAALDSLIEEELVQQVADAKSIKFSDQDITDEVESLRFNFMLSYGDDVLEQMLTQNGMTMETLRDQLRSSALIRKTMESEANVTDEDIRQFFDDNQAIMGGHPEQVRASHIIVETEEEAKEIKGLLDGGADFAELAMERSFDGSAASGGDLNFFAREDMVQAFSDVAFALQIGEISDVVQSEFGYHVIQKTDYREAAEADFDAKKSAIRAFLVSQQTVATTDSWVSDLRSKATITNKLLEEKEAKASE